MKCSIIQKSQLEGAKRMDAEYYQPEFFIDFSKGNWKLIRDVIKNCQYGLSLAMNDEKKGYPMFKMDDINNAFLFDDKVRYANIPERTFDDFKLEKNDVLFNRVNSEEFVGRTGIFKLNVNSIFASYLIRLQVGSDTEILPDYLNIFLNSKFGFKQIKKYSRRAVNQANVNAEELKQFKIAILPMSFQKEIEKISNESWKKFKDAKNFYQQAEDLLLEELDLSSFAEATADKKNLFSIVKLSEIKNAHRIDAEYFQEKYEKLISKIKNQNAKKLGKIVSMKKGFEPGSEEYQEEGKLFIRVSSVSKDEIKINDQKYLSNELYEKLKKDFEPEVGEILMTKDATPGITYVLKENIKGIISGGILRLKLKEDVKEEYLALCLNSIIGKMQAERDAGGSIIKHWKPSEIKNVQVPILPKKIQKKISNLVIQSHEARKKAKLLLDKAKAKVENLIGNN